MMSNPKITVIIPTRERCETLGASIRTCIEQDYDNLEIIVSDNVSRDRTEAVVRSFVDPRLRYIKTDRRLSMTGNYEFALSHARPGFVTIIGDDDGLMPGAVATVADLIKQTGTKAIVSSMIDYSWPNHPFEPVRNRMYIRKMGRRVERKSAKAEVNRLLASIHGSHKAAYWDLPTVYRGFIATEIIQRASSDGRYFHSMTPDVYSAFVNSLALDDFLRIERPLALEGVSGRSNGASQDYGIDRSEETKFIAEADVGFHPDLIYAPSIHIIVGEAFLQARSRFPDACNDFKFDVALICGAALRDAGGPNKDRVVQAVNEILARHEVPAVPPQTTISPVTAAWQRLVETFTAGELDCAAFGVRDVYQASLLAHHLLISCHEGGVSYGAARCLSKLGKRIGWK
jgi:glycosyltransferase involved in cell wall biosynthesis